MPFYVRSEDGVNVTDVWDTPPDSRPGWRDAVEVRPTIDPLTHYYGQHFFVLNKTPAEITWPVLAYTAEQVEANRVEAKRRQIAEYTNAVQKRLDDFAKTRNYDSMMSACTYATSTNATFAAEGTYCVSARDATWAACYTVLEAVEAGGTPPSLADLLASLPVLLWP